MPFVPFKELMGDAERRNYAVGYFESWNLESLLAVCDAAEVMHSPVIIGFSGIDLPNYEHVIKNTLSIYSTLANEMCKKLTVPVCTIFNESPYLDLVIKAIDYGFSIVMFTNEELSFKEKVSQIHRIVEKAHQASIAVEGEIASPPGLGQKLKTVPDDLHLTDAIMARSFVEQTGVDCLAVNIGQMHIIGNKKVHLDFNRIIEIKKTVSVPLVLHGSSSVYRKDIVKAINLGIRKINVGRILKRSYFEALRNACSEVKDGYNTYHVVGSGLDSDVLNTGRVALQKTVEDLMRLFGSAGKA